MARGLIFFVNSNLLRITIHIATNFWSVSIFNVYSPRTFSVIYPFWRFYGFPFFGHLNNTRFFLEQMKSDKTVNSDDQGIEGRNLSIS